MLKSLFLMTTLAVTPSTLWAEPPEVVTDIAPIHSLVSKVMSGVGKPTLLIDAGVSPHNPSLRPSQAQALQKADLVILVGAELTPWLDRRIATLAETAARIDLLDHAARTLPFRDSAEFEAHSHEDDDHDDEHSDEEHHDDHSDEDHAEVDPHAWLDPENAKAWIGVIADHLQKADPDNAGTYQSNASMAVDDMDQLTAEIRQILANVANRHFIAYHDAYHYFEARFGVTAVGSISSGDAVPPSSARVTKTRKVIAEQGITCMLSEPQFSDAIVQNIAEGYDVTINETDPHGADQEPGPDLYANLMRKLAANIATCLGG